jgi:drug/metabolite transporter (DMT)-like permease
MDPARAARARLLAAAALFSTGGAAIKLCGLTPWQVASFRAGIGAATLLLLVPKARTGWTRCTFVAAVPYAGTVLTFCLASRWTTSANAIFLQSTAPLYLLLLGPLLLREPVRRGDLAFLAAIAGGMGLFFVGVDAPRATAPDPPLGNAVGAASGLFWALTMISLRWISRRTHEPAGAAAAATVAGNLLAFLVALPLALPVVEASPTDWAVLAFLGVFQIGVAYALVTRSTSQVTALEATLLLLLEPVLNPIWSWIVHGETPGPWSLAGGAVILAATVVRAMGRSRALESAAPPRAEGTDPE